MILATFFCTEDLAHLAVEGHAGWAEAGQDVVCAAVSSLVYALAQAVQKFPNATCRFANGRATLICPRSKEIDACFALVVDGLTSLWQQYPGYIHVRRTSL